MLDFHSDRVRAACLWLIGCVLAWTNLITNAQVLLRGEMGNIYLRANTEQKRNQRDPNLQYPSQFPTIQKFRKLVNQDEMTTVLMLRLQGDTNNHVLPRWSGTGARLSIQMSGVGARSSSLRLFDDLRKLTPHQLKGESNFYDYMFAWDSNNSDHFVFSRISSDAARTNVFYSAEKSAIDLVTDKSHNSLMPSLYVRTDGICRLVCTEDDEIIHYAWNDSGPLEEPFKVCRGTHALWSGDGKRLLINRPPLLSKKNGDYSVVVRSLSSEQETEFAVRSGHLARSPTWSPHEDHFAFYVQQRISNAPWKIQVCSLEDLGRSRIIGDDVVVNRSFESQSLAWEPSGQRIWYFSNTHKDQTYYPLVAHNIETDTVQIVDYPRECTAPSDLVINPRTGVPEMVFSGHVGQPQDIFVVFLNHFGETSLKSP